MPALTRSVVGDACRHLDSWLEFRRHAERVPGVQVAVLFDDDVILSSAHGVSSTATGEALRSDHLFRIASHSKTFTATAIMQLVERGVLRLDDTVGERLPDLAESALAAVTVRELLAHGGGVIRDGRDGDFWQLYRSFPDRDDLLRTAGDRADVQLRNERFKYSNIGFSLLGLIIEGVSGQSYRAHLAEHIIGPLGLSDTGAEYDPARADEFAGGHTALAYADERLPIDHVDTAAMAAATGCYSTAADTVRYAAAHFHGDERLVSETSRRQMFQTQWKVEGIDEEYGLGFQIVEVGERRLHGHGGGYPGHITRTLFDPVDRLAVSVFTNAIDGPAAAWATVAIKLVDLAVRAAAEGDDSTADRRATFCGRFATLWGVFDIVDLGGRLHQMATVAEPTATPTRLEIVDDDTLRIVETSGYASPGELVTFERDGDGIVSVRSGSSTAHPIDAYRRAVAGRSRVTVGDPIRPASTTTTSAPTPSQDDGVSPTQS